MLGGGEYTTLLLWSSALFQHTGFKSQDQAQTGCMVCLHATKARSLKAILVYMTACKFVARSLAALCSLLCVDLWHSVVLVLENLPAFLDFRQVTRAYSTDLYRSSTI